MTAAYEQEVVAESIDTLAEPDVLEQFDIALADDWRSPVDSRFWPWRSNAA